MTIQKKPPHKKPQNKLEQLEELTMVLKAYIMDEYPPGLDRRRAMAILQEWFQEEFEK